MQIHESVGTHCVIPQKTSKVVSVQEFQLGMMHAKNKGQMLRVCLRTLSSMGYNVSQDEQYRKKIEQYLEDFEGE